MNSLLRLAGLGLFVGLLAMLDHGALADLVRGADKLAIVAALMLFYPILGLKTLRLHALLSACRQSTNPRRLFQINLAGYFAGTVTPGRTGEFSRIAYLKSEGMSLSESLACVTVDKALDVLFLLLAAVGLLAISDLPIQIGQELPVSLIAGGAMLVLAIAGWLVLRTSFRSLLAESWATVKEVKPTRMIEAAFWTAGSWALCFGQILLLARSLHIALGPADLITAYVASSAVGLLPITYAGIGTRDAVLVGIFSTYGLPAEAAIALSLGILLLYLAHGLLSLPAWIALTGKSRAGITMSPTVKTTECFDTGY